MNIRLKETERLDELHRNGYWIIQDPEKFCFGMDAVLLSGYVKVKPGEKALVKMRIHRIYRVEKPFPFLIDQAP